MKLKPIWVVVLVIVVIGIVWYWLIKPKPTDEPASANCPQERMISVDLEASSYDQNNVTQVVGNVTGDFDFEALEYNLVAYTNAQDMINEFDVVKNATFSPASDHQTGWQKLALSQTAAPVSFTLVPGFSNTWTSRPYLGIYFKVTCSDGTATPDTKLTRMYIDKHPIDTSLFGVGTNNPLTTKYFK